MKLLVRTSIMRLLLRRMVFSLDFFFQLLEHNCHGLTSEPVASRFQLELPGTAESGRFCTAHVYRGQQYLRSLLMLKLMCVEVLF